jgi:hypothetical protein
MFLGCTVLQLFCICYLHVMLFPMLRILYFYIIIIIIIIFVIAFMQSIYNNIHQKRHIATVYSVAAVLYLQFVLHVMLFRA